MQLLDASLLFIARIYDIVHLTSLREMVINSEVTFPLAVDFLLHVLA
jgi:hypothetical protein